MARKNREGKFIIAAGEVGQYTVCPEAWRLKVVEQVAITPTAASSEGDRLHNEWSKKIDKAAHLGEGLRFLFALLVTTIVIVVMY